MKLRLEYQVLLLALLTLVVYYPSISAPINSLDDQLLVQRLLNEEGFSLSRHFSPGGVYDYYRPLLTLTFEIDKFVGGLQDCFMHLVNILIHAFNVFLIFCIARYFSRLFGREEGWLPFVAAALFSVHPMNAEAVNWISGRPDLLAGTFVFATILILLLALERKSVALGACGALTLLAGALCKETALFLLPGIYFLFLVRSVKKKELWSGRWIVFAFCIAAVICYFFMRQGVYQTDRGIARTTQLIAQAASVQKETGGVHPTGFPFADALRVALKTSGFYAVKLVQPLPLNFAITKVSNLYLLPGAILALVLPLLVCYRRPVGALYLMTFFLGSSALLVLFTGLAWTLIAERYMYIPSAIFVVASVFGVAPWLKRRVWTNALPIAVLLLISASAWATMDRNVIWQDNLTLYLDTVRKSPDFAPAKNELAQALYAHNRPDEADSIMATIRVPSGLIASLNPGLILWQQGQHDKARQWLLIRLQKSPEHERRILDLLVRITDEMAAKSPDQEEQRRLFQQNIVWLERLERLTNGSFYWYRLGQTHLFLNQRSEAQRSFAEAAMRLPEHSPYKEPARKLARELLP